MDFVLFKVSMPNVFCISEPFEVPCRVPHKNEFSMNPKHNLSNMRYINEVPRVPESLGKVDAVARGLGSG